MSNSKGNLNQTDKPKYSPIVDFKSLVFNKMKTNNQNLILKNEANIYDKIKPYLR